MSGRRLLDAAAIFKASRGVLAKHLTLRQHQLDNYNNTSSLSKAVKSQTDRVTLTVKAASVLAERFNGPGPGYTTKALQSEWVGQSLKNGNRASPTQGKEELEKDHFRERSERNTRTEQSPQHDINVNQEKPQSHPLPDGSVLVRGGTPKTGAQDVFKLRVELEQEQNAFSSPSQSNGSNTSALPMVKLPTNTEDTQESDEHVPDDQINQDVFYSSKTKDQERLPYNEAVPDHDELPEEAYSGIFQSRKVSKMLHGQPMGSDPSKGLDLPGAKEVPIKDSKAADQTDYVNSSMRTSPHSGLDDSCLAIDPELESSINRGNEDVYKLAAEMAKDADTEATDPLAPSGGLADAPNKSSYGMRESKVPSSRFGRIWQYGGLATSLAFGAVSESFRRATGSGGEAGGSLMLSETNMERLVARLSKMRGAALKLGQMMSFQDSKMLPKPIHDVLQRVQDSADYMPPSQRNRVLSSNLGADWRALFSAFDENPLAAASIGQVHRATLASNSQSVAVKVQYPGVASSIDSDLSNLAILLTASRLLPKGLYLDKTIANARVELAWECDYIREAEMSTRFRDLLADEADIYHVPAIIKEASGPQVLTAEFVEGIGVTKGHHFTQEQKDWIGTHILRLCLREITEFKFMQTDPNWTNFLFNPESHKLELLDFGASRDFPDKFILPYIRTLLAASRGDREQVRDLSIELGYLTGHESQAMANAHVSSVLTLAEPFAEMAPEMYDFRDQTITDRVRGFIPVMLRERLVPPPEETYSIHRKLSGAFLLCAKLGSRIRCREMFEDSMGKAGML